MNKLLKRFKKGKLFARLLFFLIGICYLVGFIFFTKNIVSLTSVETLIRYIAIGLFLLYFIFYLFYSLVKIGNKKYAGFYINSLISIIFIVIFFFSSKIIGIGLDMLSGLLDSDKITYTSNLIALNKTEFDEDSIIGLIKDEDNIEGNILAKRLIKENKLTNKTKYYDDPLEMLYALYNGDVDAAFVSNNYVILYSSEEDFASIGSETKILYEISGEFKNKDLSLASNKSLTEPVTVLIMGVDSESDGLNANAAFNGDTLILATFNPKTLSATLFSIPRDTYVPIACRGGVEAKINSSAAYSTSCVIDTVEDLTKVDIDYYVKIDFKGVVDLVEALGGVDVFVEEPYTFNNQGHNCNGMVCEQNSDRQWGDKTVYIGLGNQHLDGEQALAYARCRHMYADSDLARNRHQQDIILAIAKKAAQIRNYDEFKKVFDAVSNNIATNMSTDQILSGYDILKDMVSRAMQDEEFINIRKSYLEIYNLNVYLPSGMVTYALGYYKDSLEEITEAMRINLDLEKPTLTKNFNYSINEVYQENIAGKNLRGEKNSYVIEDFVGKMKEDTKDYCESNNYDCNYIYIDKSSKYYDASFDSDMIAYQDPHAGTIATDVDEINFYIIGAID